MTPSGPPSAPPRDRLTTGGRLGSLDLLRGIVVAAMIVVNNPGNWNSVYPQLLHSAWHGVTLADLIFPAFIFIMGVAMAFTFARAGGRQGRGAGLRRILIRSAVLVVLGLVLNAAAAWPDLESIRIPGVLQRIGVTYLCAALISRSTSDAGQWAWATALLLGHWAALLLPLGLPGSGHLEPGHNAAAAIDRMLFGTHLLTADGDPEGALGLLSSVATALLGAAVGRWLLRDAARREALARDQGRGPLAGLAIAGGALVAAGLAWAVVLPLNKPLWTGSFAVLACGAATLLLAGVAAVTPVHLSPRSHPLLWLGVNPLAIYFLSELSADFLQRGWLAVGGQALPVKDWVFWTLLAPAVGDNGGPLSSLAYALLFTAMWIAVAGVLFRRGVRIRV